MTQIVVVDDSQSVRESVRMILTPTWTLSGATLSDDVCAMLAREPAELIVLGLSSPLERPLGVLRRVLLADERVRVLLLAESALLGAAQRIFNYRIEAILPKPFDAHVLRSRVQAIFSGVDHLPTLLEEVERAQTQAASLPEENLAILLPRSLRHFVKRAAATTAPIVIEGERGTGKTALAHLIHRESPWRAAPYLRLEARGLTEERLAASLRRVAESTPMGERRATLCLEEVGSLAGDLRLLVRDLVEGHPPPGTPMSVRRMHFRFLATTSDSLVDLTAAGTFREDLRQALSVLVLRLPPVRARMDEIEILARTFVEDWGRRYAREAVHLSPSALDRLRAYLWPGNLRELRAAVGRALALTDGSEILPEAIVLVDDHMLSLAEESIRPKGVGGPPVEETRAASPVEALVPPPALDILVHLLSHEVKNPLLAIKTFTQLLKSKFDDPEFREDFYRVMSNDVKRIDALVEAASAFAQFGPPCPTSVNVNEMIDQILKHHELAFLHKRIVVLRESDESLPRALADHEQLLYALRCILSKAVDLIPEGGDIHFTTTSFPREAGRKARVQTRVVFANPDGVLTQIAGVVGSGAASDATPGSLELTLAANIVVRQGGMLRVESHGARHTVITLVLPAV